MKSKYESHIEPRLEEIKAWARDGVCDKDIAHNLSVAYSTFRKYRGMHSALAAALAQGKDYVDKVIVTNAYLKRILGYDAVEVRRDYAYEADPETGDRVRVLKKETEQTRHIPGDPRAAEFWLVNRQSAAWSYKPGGKDGGEEGGGVVLLPEVKQDDGST